MKRKTFYVLLAAEAALCLLWCFLQSTLPGMTASALAFPFWQLARALAALSALGGAGRLAAAALWALLGASPLLLMRRGRLRTEDALPPLLSAGLLLSLWLMASPARLENALGAETFAAALGLTLWSLLAAWAVIRALRYFFESDGDRLLGAAGTMLRLLCAAIVLVLGAELSGLPASLRTVAEGNTARPGALGLTYAMLTLRFLASALPLVLDIILSILGLDLLDALREDRYSEGSAQAAKRLSRFCCKALVSIVLVSAAVNVIQLLCLKALASVDITANLPILSLAFALCALLLSRLITDRKRLKDDNDLYI